jgi:hypothetical protein
MPPDRAGTRTSAACPDNAMAGAKADFRGAERLAYSKCDAVSVMSRLNEGTLFKDRLQHHPRFMFNKFLSTDCVFSVAEGADEQMLNFAPHPNFEPLISLIDIDSRFKSLLPFALRRLRVTMQLVE